MADEKGKAGRKGKYDTHVKPYFDKIETLLNNGATEKQIAETLGVSYPAWNKYKSEYAELKELCDKPRTKLVLSLRGSLVKKAMGFSKRVKRAMKLKEVIYENGKRLRETERIEYYDDEVYFPPETTAIFGALNLYDEEYVKDKKAHELKKRELELKEQQAEMKDF